MAYLKPQSPITYGEDHIYPLTTVDQIIMDDGQRLSGVGVYLEAPDASEDTTVETGLDADTLGGILPSSFVLDSELDEYKNEISSNYVLKTDTIENANNAVNAVNAVNADTSNNSNNTDSFNGYAFDAFKSYMLDLAHPVGSYYWSSKSTNPSSLFGGTWEQIKDKFILAAGSSYSVGATGGAATHTLTTEQLPKITGTIVAGAGNAGASEGGYGAFRSASGVMSVSGERQYAGNVSQGAWPSGSAYERFTMSFGGGSSHNNMPPYLVAYCWCRTA